MFGNLYTLKADIERLFYDCLGFYFLEHLELKTIYSLTT